MYECHKRIKVKIDVDTKNINATVDGNTRQMSTTVERSGANVIDDNVVSRNKTWSSQKITDEMSTAHVREADKLSTPRIIGVSGDISGEVMFDGTEDSYIFSSVSVLTNEDLEAILQ